MVANLLDNELKHLPASCTVWLTIRAAEDSATLLVEDNGLGFDLQPGQQLFEQRARGKQSKGH